MTIAIPTNDKLTLAKRTGQASYFAFYQVKNGRYDEAVFRKNPQKHEQHHHGKDEHHHSHPEILELLDGVDLILVMNIGKYMKADFEANGKAYVKTKEIQLTAALEEYLQNNK